MVNLIAQLAETVQRSVHWLNDANGHYPSEVTLRILKIGEEFGEASAAWIGYMGQNPRKELTHNISQVADELCDVIISAMVALASLPIDDKGFQAEWQSLLHNRANYIEWR